MIGTVKNNVALNTQAFGNAQPVQDPLAAVLAQSQPQMPMAQDQLSLTQPNGEQQQPQEKKGIMSNKYVKWGAIAGAVILLGVGGYKLLKKTPEAGKDGADKAGETIKNAATKLADDLKALFGKADAKAEDIENAVKTYTDTKTKEKAAQETAKKSLLEDVNKKLTENSDQKGLFEKVKEAIEKHL